MSEGRKTLISVLVVIVLLAGLITWLALGMKQASKLDMSVTEKNSKLTDLLEKIAAVPALRQEQQKLAGELKEYETILPNDRELNKIFDTLSEYEEKAGLEIRTFSPIREKTNTRNAPETSYKRVGYELDLTGDYFSFVKFLNLLENHNRFVQVDSFSVKQKDENNPVNGVTMRVSTFVFDPKAKRSPSASRRKVGRTAAARRKREVEVPFDLQEELASRYTFRSEAKLRDPFTNPLTRRVDVAMDKPDPSRILTPKQEKTRSEAIDKQLGLTAVLIGDGKLKEAEKLLADTRDLMNVSWRDTECARRQTGFGRRSQRLGIMLRSAQGEEIYEIVQEKQAEMVKAFEADDYDRVYQLRDAVDALTGAAGKARRGGNQAATADSAEPIHPRLPELVKACERLCERADARREFAGVQINIQGTFWTVRNKERRAAAIINGQTLVEGERLKLDVGTSGRTRTGRTASKLDAEIIVKKIDREKITFLYKREVIHKLQFDY